MTGFIFDAKAVLEAAQNLQTVPSRPNLPNWSATGGARLGRLGRLGLVRASYPEMTAAELARDIFEERAAIREFEAGQDRAQAEAAAWQEAIRLTGITALDEWRQGSDGNRHGKCSRKMEGDSDER